MKKNNILPGDETTQLLQNLISIDSCDPRGSEISIARFVHQFLLDQGIEAELDEFIPERANVYARIKGKGSKPGLIFSAHLDTVPIGEQAWHYPPFGGVIEDGKIYGRGATDMKSGMAAMIAAAIGIVRRKEHLEGDLILAFSAGESSNCLGAKRFIETKQLDGAGALLVSEPTSLKVLTGEKGALWIRITAHGHSGHQSGNDKASGGGNNAIVTMLNYLQKLTGLPHLREQHNLLGKASVNIGTIRGGTVVNLTPDKCMAEVDFRPLPSQSPEKILKEMKAISSDLIDFEVIDFKEPIVTSSNNDFVTLCQRACLKSGLSDITPKGVGYYSDATILTPALNTPMVIIGPGELGMSGASDEYCEVKKLVLASEIFYDIAIDYLADQHD